MYYYCFYSYWGRVWILALILLFLLLWLWVEEIFSISVSIDLFLPCIPCFRCPPVKLSGHLLLLKKSDSEMANSSSRADDDGSDLDWQVINFSQTPFKPKKGEADNVEPIPVNNPSSGCSCFLLLALKTSQMLNAT